LLLEAERLYQDAVAADNASAQAHAGLAQVRERSGDADAARKEAHESLELGPSANSDGAQALLIEMDTPGGLLDSMRDMVGAFCARGSGDCVCGAPRARARVRQGSSAGVGGRGRDGAGHQCRRGASGV
jgi:hypothetical protein